MVSVLAVVMPATSLNPRLCPENWYPLDAVEDRVLVRLSDCCMDELLYAEEAEDDAADG